MSRQYIAGWVAVTMLASGCASSAQAKRMRTLEQQLATLQDELTQRNRQLASTTAEHERFLEAQRQLAEQLKAELSDARAKLELTERGLVVTLLDRVLFDSGQAELRADGQQVLGKVAGVVQHQLPDAPIAVEGHTDNEPIQHSGWPSNWELSTARATSVIHYLIDQQGMAPARLRAVGYGEHHPVADNATAAGRQRNRRVEVVILPAQPQETVP